MSTFQRINGLMAPHRGTLCLAAVLSLLACLCNLPTPLLIQRLVDEAAAGGRAALLPLYAVGLLAVFAAQAATNLATTLVVGRVGLEVVRDLRHRLYVRLQEAGLSYYDKTSPGAIISRLMDDVTAVQGLVTNQTVTILSDLATAAAVAGLLWYRSPWLFLVALAALPAHVASFRWFSRRIRAGAEAVRTQLDGVFGQLKDRVDGMLVVKAHAREEAEMERFAAQIDAAHGPRLYVERMSTAFSSLSLALSGVGTSLVFAVGALEVLYGRLTPGEVVAAGTLSALLFGPVTRLADLAAAFQKAGAGVTRLGEILDLKPDVPESQNPLPLGRPRGLVEFDQVSFGYRAGAPVLWDIRLRVAPGTRVALVGPTGCGKTTLLNLLLRFYDPTWGEIRLDGTPLRRLALAELRRQIGVVPQDAVLFRQTLADNIRYGTPGAADADVRAAAEAALVAAFAGSLPDGYDTVIGEGGHQLSQGQRQQVAVARVLCKNPPLVVLDEATSALDAESEALIQAALANLLRGRTAFIIAHRLATVRDADRIVVLDGGEIAQIGTHAELLGEPNGLYRRYCLHQFGRTEAPRKRVARSA